IKVFERADRRAANARIVLDQQNTRAGHVDIRSLAALRRRMQPHGRSRFGAREINRNDGAPADLALNSDLAARLVREAEDLTEAETGALAHWLGGEEGLERPLEHVGGHAA